MGKLLGGVRVLDLTNVLAGPYCGYQLALLGADVIKVEMPGRGDLARQLGADPQLNARNMGGLFLAQNAGKRSIILDLKEPADKASFLDLVGMADVLVENFRPGVMQRLGLAYDDLRLMRKDLIYCAISGFGQTGPLKDNPAYDQIIQGLSGIMSITGTKEVAPLRVGYPVCDTIGGLFGAFAISSALVRRERTGEGAFIDVSMLESTLSALGWPASNYLISGVTPTPMGNENATAAPSGTFQTGDGLLNIAANKQEQFCDLCDAIGRPELVSDPRFASAVDRLNHRYILQGLIEDGLKSASAATWEKTLSRVGVPAGRVLTVPEVLQEPQVIARDMMVSFDDVPGVGHPISILRGGFLIDSDAPMPERPPPAFGEHSDEIAAEIEHWKGSLMASTSDKRAL
jgi:crotonobetainyl-CoA:carnitine CoA-transferase CaiB-like acyl-CoA transferase